MNLRSLITVDYENIANWKLGENKPNSKPIKANTKPIKANTNPISEKPKMKLNSYSTKDYENKPRSNPGKTNPIKPNLVRRSLGEGGFKMA